MPSYSNHPSQRPPPPGLSHPPRSPRSYPTDVADRDWDRERRGRHLQEYPGPPPHQMFSARAHSPPYRSRSPGPRSARDYSPPQPSPRNIHQSVPSRSYPSPWAESKSTAPRSPPTQPLPDPHQSRRYDPRNDGRDPRELRDYDPMDTRPDLRSRPPSHHASRRAYKTPFAKSPRILPTPRDLRARTSLPTRTCRCNTTVAPVVVGALGGSKNLNHLIPPASQM